MHFIWIQHWTALPVIIEEGRMSDHSRQPGGKLPQGQPSGDPSTGTDLSETEGYQPLRTCGKSNENASPLLPNLPPPRKPALTR